MTTPTLDPPAVVDDADDQQAAVAQLAEPLRAKLTAREAMRFETTIGMSLDELETSSVAQMVFLLWASRLHGDHPARIDDLLDTPLNDLVDQVMKIASRAGKASGEPSSSPSSTGNGSPSSQPSGTPTTSPSTSSSG